MNNIFHALFYPLSNAIMSGFMIVILLYWIFSFLGIGFGDLDIDADVDTDFDVGSTTHSDVDDSQMHSDSSGDGVFMKFLKFMNVGKVPFMLVLSTLKFFTWAGSLITTEFTVVGNWGWKSILILIPCFFIGAVLTRYATKPLARFLKKTGYQGEESIDFLGRSGKMYSTIQGNKMGNAEFIIDKSPLKLNVVSHSGEEIKYGESVFITDESDDKKYYYVTKEITLDQN